MPSRDSILRRRLLKWYDAHRRDLPWRVPPGTRINPYHVLVSETMLQQTQVSQMTPHFLRFIERLPTLADLAAADEQVVLRLWQGLGYYSRARNLRATARLIIENHGGAVPSDVETLLALPGIGRYTAGAIASIGHDCRAPILDGNVTRVLCRLEAIEDDPRLPAVRNRLWARAEETLPRGRCGDFNSSLMELGSVICTPRKPQCLICPVKAVCRAYELGLQDLIPVPKKSKPTPLFYRRVFCIERAERDGINRYLMEQRPPTGRWAGLWQFITVEVEREEELLALPDIGLKLTRPAELGRVEHALTHRRYSFTAYRCGVVTSKPCSVGQRRWLTLLELETYPLSKPQLSIARMLSALTN